MNHPVAARDPAPRRRLSRRALLKLAAGSALGTAVLGAGGVTYARAIEPDWVAVERVRLTLPRLHPAFDGYRLVQISDIHMDKWMTPERLATATRLVNEQRPDAVAITGDFVTYTPRHFAPHLVAVLRTLAPRDATVAVLGNHDHWTDAAVVRGLLRDSGVPELRNATHSLRRGDAVLHLAGVDDVWEGHADLGHVLARLPREGGAILLAHEPDFADTSAATGRFDLQLSGHSHGGQIRLPLAGPPVLPPYARRYPSGRYQVGEMITYTNRGLGMVEPYGRFNCRPEITVFTLAAPRP